MKSFRLTLLVALMLLAIPTMMHAQGGCVDSPEAPTDVLILVGSIGMIYGSSAVMKLSRKIKGKSAD